jgi:hypothetical protein
VTWPLYPSLFCYPTNIVRYAVAQFIEALRYKSECRWFNSRWFNWNFLFSQSFRPHCDPGIHSASNRNECMDMFVFLGRLRRPVGRTDNLTTFMCQLSWNSSASWSPQGLSRPVRGLLHIYWYSHYTYHKISIVLFLPPLCYFLRYWPKHYTDHPALNTRC